MLSITNRLLISLLSIISVSTMVGCDADKPENKKDSLQFNPAEVTHLKEEMLNGRVQKLVKYSYGPVVKTENGWIKGNIITKRNSMFGENGNLDLTMEEYYGDAEVLLGKQLIMYQYDKDGMFAGATVTNPAGDITTQTVEWDENKRTTTSFAGEDISNMNKVVEIQVCSFNPDGAVSTKVVDDGTGSIVLYGYNYKSDNTIITVQDKTSNVESKIYKTVLEKDKHNNPLVVVLSNQPFDGNIADGYEEYEYTYWDE